MYSIVIVEDDFNFANQLKEVLEKFNYKVTLIEDFNNVSQQIIKGDFHLVIMDVNLVKHDGFYWTQKIRQESNIPIIFLSSRDKQLEKVMAMSYGADDYLTKPVDQDLLLVKIQAVLRRTYDYDIDKQVNSIEVGNYKLDLTKFEIKYYDKAIDLTKNEFKILQKLMSSANEFVSREELMTYLWESESFIDDNAFNVNLSRLRKKIIELSGEDRIITKRQVGYKFYED